MSLKIRKFKINDILIAYELLNELYEGKIDLKVFKKLYLLKLKDEFSYNIFATLDDKIIGLLTAEMSVKLQRKKKVFFIDSIIVREEYRNKGAASFMIESAINYAKKHDCDVVELTSRILNETAHKFYENRGFKKHSYKFKKHLDI